MIILLNSESVIKEFFGGYLPSGKLGSCDLYAYCPNHTDSIDNYQIIKGIVYFHNNQLRVTPDTTYWKYFYNVATTTGSATSYVSQKEIGLNNMDCILSFNILDTAPTYENLRADVPILDINDIPVEFQTKTYTVKAQCYAWATTSKDIEINCTRQDKDCTITLPVITSVCSSTKNYLTGGHIMIGCSEMLNTFFSGLVPTGSLAACRVRSLFPNHIESEII